MASWMKKKNTWQNFVDYQHLPIFTSHHFTKICEVKKAEIPDSTIVQKIVKNYFSTILDFVKDRKVASFWWKFVPVSVGAKNSCHLVNFLGIFNIQISCYRLFKNHNKLPLRVTCQNKSWYLDFDIFLQMAYYHSST